MKLGKHVIKASSLVVDGAKERFLPETDDLRTTDLEQVYYFKSRKVL